MTPVLAAPKDYENLEYTVDDQNTITLANAPGDGSSTFKQYSSFSPVTVNNFGDKRITIQGLPPRANLQCPLDAVVKNGNNTVSYYRFVAGKGEGMGAFGAVDQIAGGCKDVMKVDPKYNGIAGKLKAADKQQATDEEVCEDHAAFGGFLCLILNGISDIISGIYNKIFSYAAFTLFNPVEGDAAGKNGVSAANYDKLKSVWQTFARLASLILVAAFITMIIATSASRS